LGRFNSELHENSSSSSFLSSLSLNATYLGSDENEKSLSLKISTNSIATQKNRTEFFIFESTSSLTPQTTTNTKSTNTESKDNYPPTTLQNNDSATPNFTENNHNFSKIFQLTKFKNLNNFPKKTDVEEVRMLLSSSSTAKIAATVASTTSQTPPKMPLPKLMTIQQSNVKAATLGRQKAFSFSTQAMPATATTAAASNSTNNNFSTNTNNTVTNSNSSALSLAPFEKPKNEDKKTNFDDSKILFFTSVLKTVAPLMSSSTQSIFTSKTSSSNLLTKKNKSHAPEASVIDNKNNNITDNEEGNGSIKKSDLIQFGNRFRVFEGKQKTNFKIESEPHAEI